MCQPGLSTLGTCGSNPYPTSARAAPAPQTRWEINPRLDTMIGAKNTLTARFEYEAGSSTNNGGNNSLPTRGNTSSSADETIQISDTQLVSSKVINETRFEYEHDSSSTNPFNTGTSVSVQGYVNAFGSNGGSVNYNTQDHIELQNYTSIQLAKNFVRLGGRLRTSSETNNSNGGSAGSVSYSYLLDPCSDPSVTNKPSNCVVTTTPCLAANIAAGRDISSYQCGIPFQFSQTTINNLTISARETDVGLYAEDDWKVTPNFTWSYGVRYEAQTTSAARTTSPRAPPWPMGFRARRERRSRCFAAGLASSTTALAWAVSRTSPRTTH